VVSEAGWRDLKRFWRAFGASLALAGMGLMPLQAGAASTLPFGLPQPRPAFPFALDGSSVSPGALSPPDFDPAAALFSSLLSYEAMRTIAPNTFGDFVSALPVPGQGLSSAFGTSGMSAVAPMSSVEGIDPDVAAMLSGAVSSVASGQLGGAAGGGGGSGGGASVGGGIGSSSSGVNVTGAVVGSPGGAVIGSPGTLSAISNGAGIAPTCGANEVSTRLQAGGQYWSGQAVSAAPVQFPPGVFAGMEGGNPLGDLGPTGSPTNIAPQGAAGAWCVPPPTPFSESSPLESHVLWIAFILVGGGILVFFLSRGVHRPARSFEGSSVVVQRKEVWLR
jgi:hypothetical protein